MANPTGYSRSYSFTGYQTANPADPLPGDEVDGELDNIATAIGSTQTALADIRRSDGKLQNNIVTADSVTTDFIETVIGMAEGSLSAVEGYGPDLTHFSSVWLGAAAANPTSGVGGAPLAAGMMYFNTTSDEYRVYDGAAWQFHTGLTQIDTYFFVAATGQQNFYGTDASGAAVAVSPGALLVSINGVGPLREGFDFVVRSAGNGIDLAVECALGDEVQITSFRQINLSNVAPEVAADADRAEAALDGALAAEAFVASLKPRATRAEFVADVASGDFDAVADGVIAFADGISYRRQTGATAIADIPGWVPTFPVYSEHFGAVSDNSSVDCAAAIQAAVNYSRLVHFRNANYYCSGPIYLPTKQVLVGARGPNGNSTSIAGGTRLIFTGSGAACFSPQDTGTFISHGSIRGITLRITGSYDWAFDMPWCSAWHWQDLEIQPTSTTCGGIRSLRDTSDGSSNWLNLLENVTITLPAGSTARPLEHTWSDSRIINGALSGGLGTLDMGAGNIYSGVNLERSYGYGLTLKKMLPYAGSIVIGCFMDANAAGGVRIDVSGDPSTNTAHFVLHHQIVGNKFRSISPYDGSYAAADITFTGHAGRVYRGGTIGPNVHTLTAVPPYQIAPALFEDTCFVTGTDMSDTSMPSVTGLTKFAAFGPRGLSVPDGPSILRGYQSILGSTGVGALIGAPIGTGGGAGVVLGALSGTVPFIGASQDASAAWQALRFRTSDTDRWELMTNGILRPSADATYDLGTTTYRVRKAYAQTFHGSFPGPYADDSAAAAAGVEVGQIYRKSGGTVVWRQT